MSASRAGPDGPLVTVGMPVRDAARTLPTALGSIVAQTYGNWVLHVVDDGSRDDTVGVARAFEDPRIRVYADGGRVGIARRLNQLIGLASGEYFARMDGDDVAYPTRLAEQVRYLEANPAVDLLGTAILVFGPGGRARGKRAAPESHARICASPHAGFPLAHPTWMGRAGWFAARRFDPAAERCEDQELLLRSHADSRFGNLPRILLGYRESLTIGTQLRTRRGFARALARHYWKRDRRVRAVGAVAAQGLKASVDAVATLSGLEYRVLRHRARPVHERERRRWAHAWQRARDAAGEHGFRGGV